MGFRKPVDNHGKSWQKSHKKSHKTRFYRDFYSVLATHAVQVTQNPPCNESCNVGLVLWAGVEPLI